VLAFTALAVLQGMTMRAVAARLDLPPLPLAGRAVAAGRVAAAAVTLVALPGLVAAMADIIG
jgi:hypothetical protein